MPGMLHVASPLMQGADVADLQKRLTALGYAPVDEQYAPAGRCPLRVAALAETAFHLRAPLGNAAVALGRRVGI